MVSSWHFMASVCTHVGGLINFPPSLFPTMAACVSCHGVAATVNRLNCCSLYPLMRPLVAIIVLALPVLSTDQQERKLFETM